MDADISRWLLEFLVRQPLDDRLFDAIVRVLPVQNADLRRCKKSNLLRMIESEISTGSVSENVLELLERIAELHSEEGIQCSEAMKAAYCSVAVDCTVRFLDGNEDYKECKFFNAIKTIWRGGVCEMEELNQVGLVSQELLFWKDDIEAAVRDSNVGENLCVMSKNNNALEVVRIYLAEAKGRSGPSFLELVADKLGDESFKANLPNSVRTRLTFGRNGISRQVAEGAVSNSSKEIRKGNLLRRCKHVAPKCYRRAKTRASVGVKIDSTEECGLGTVGNQYDLPLTPEVNKVLEALGSSSMGLNAMVAMVNDPLPEALDLSETGKSSFEREKTCHNPMVKNCGLVDDATNTSGVNNAESGCANEDNVGNSYRMHHSISVKPRLMEQTFSTHTYEKYKNGKPRRKIKRWSDLEENALRAGVQKYGLGKWKHILNAYHDIFEDRSGVDLKDKWRNLTS